MFRHWSIHERYLLMLPTYYDKFGLFVKPLTQIYLCLDVYIGVI